MGPPPHQLLPHTIKHTHVKATKIMLAVIATLTLTAMTFGLIGYLLTDLTYKQCMQSPGVWITMLMIGWIPSVIVGSDLEEHA